MNWNMFMCFVIGFAIGYLFDVVVVYKQKLMNKINKPEVKQ